jgi:outer membrane protein OmpA-like peptidoglycan-associated protein
MNKTRRVDGTAAASWAQPLTLLLLPLLNALSGAAVAAGPPTIVDSQTIIRSLQPPSSGTRSLIVAPRDGAGGAPAVAERKMILDIRFANDSDRLTQAAHAQLAQLGGALKSAQLAQSRFLIAGHTSSSGSPRHNLRLPEARARSVRSYLLERFSIAPERIEATGFGSSRPLATFAPGALQQRRVEISTLSPAS